ncbi:hypothetical protein G6F70_008616 [Rhizopus microsporus]|nr:hypothetical protein G6F71_001182 [Rhizopus microsporus]KAG1194945.1 hypothetical protein G6F70_008616 [Rhizopus microsporus]KAG1214660.1 hypothetical protein G6F69_001695 [Rhizopus microsporus]KAG1234250.1 hypothetical protein G6F67_003650 [Rhizopus microsporus]KAG1262719.1 hypothetical protein G6F68_005703 [Rhizopus microsporus]
MDDINNNEPEILLTTADALALFKRLQIEERHGSELSLEISEYLDSTPTYELKKEFTRFKKQVAKYRNDNRNKQHQINKKLISELKKQEQRQKYTSGFFIYKEKIQFENPKVKDIFDGTIDQAAKLATFGFGQAKFQDNGVRDYATKALRLPASTQHKGKSTEEDSADNTFGQKFMADLHQARLQQRLLYNNISNNQQPGRPHGKGGFRGSNRGYTRFNTRSVGGDFHQRGNGNGN